MILGLIVIEKEGGGVQSMAMHIGWSYQRDTASSIRNLENIKFLLVLGIPLDLSTVPK